MLDRVTITGADDNTPVEGLLKLSARFPFVEWGVLVSKSREGLARYPTRGWCAEFARAVKDAGNARVSMHVCGAWARQMFAGQLSWTELPLVCRVANRVQINGVPESNNPPDWGLRPHIVQYPQSGGFFDIATRQYGLNVYPLFDASGGRGEHAPDTWTDLPEPYVGYAGGISPDNVEDSVRRITAIRSLPFWIDMEGQVRDEKDCLDLGKVERVLKICEGLMPA